MSGFVSDLPEWTRPATWHVGDPINADNWSSRIYDPLRLILRRPLTVVTRTTDATVASGGGQSALAFNTVIQDDTGMFVDDGAATFTDLICQRDGVYAVYISLPYIGNSSTDATCVASIFVNSNQIYKRESAVVGTSVGQDHYRSVNGDVYMTEGDILNAYVWNNTAATITISATNNAPRMAALWKRPFVG